MAICAIGLGSNLGDRAAHLQKALQQLEHLPGSRLIRVSQWIETEPVGGPAQGPYLNGAATMMTELPAEELLLQMKRIEEILGRTSSSERWGPRVIDLDLLFYDDLVLETPRLILPHPRIEERLFVLIPLAQIDPDWRHPRLNRTASELLQSLQHADSPKSG